MTRDALIETLKRLSVETGSLVCLGCGHEHHCATSGCAILREAVKQLANERWIPVAERLPEIGQTVLVCRPDTVGPGVLYGDGWWRIYGTRIKKVSYWRPLPTEMEETKLL